LQRLGRLWGKCVTKDEEITFLKRRAENLKLERNAARFELERIVEVFKKSEIGELSWRLELAKQYVSDAKSGKLLDFDDVMKKVNKNENKPKGK
jgi:hypothetical protein